LVNFRAFQTSRRRDGVASLGLSTVRAYRCRRAGAAVEMHRVPKEQYGQALGAHLQDLYQRLKPQRYRHQLIRRVRTPKDHGKTEILGIATCEDKLVQDAVCAVLEAIDAQDFQGRTHGAVHTLDQVVHRGEVQGSRLGTSEAVPNLHT
jgi:hypothetical protein